MVGRRHQRQTIASQNPGWECRQIPNRICCPRGSRRSSPNDQQSLRTPEPASNHHQYALGALLSRGTTSQGAVHTRCVHHLRKKLDCPTLGQSATGTNQDCRSGALAASNRGGGWDQSQDQVRDVGFVFTRRSLGVLWPQSHLVGHTGWKRGQARTQHRCPNQRQASEIPLSLVTRRGHTRSGTTGIPGPAPRISRRCFRNTSGRTRGSALARLRFRKHELERSTLVLLASRWAPEVHQDGSFGQVVADASKPETCLAGLEISESYDQPEHFVFPSERLKGNKPLDLASVLKKKVQP